MQKKCKTKPRTFLFTSKEPDDQREKIGEWKTNKPNECSRNISFLHFNESQQGGEWKKTHLIGRSMLGTGNGTGTGTGKQQDHTGSGIIFTTTTHCSLCVSLLVFPPTLHAAAHCTSLFVTSTAHSTHIHPFKINHKCLPTRLFFFYIGGTCPQTLGLTVVHFTDQTLFTQHAAGSAG